jgi:hypothetical protein
MPASKIRKKEPDAIKIDSEKSLRRVYSFDFDIKYDNMLIMIVFALF